MVSNIDYDALLATFDDLVARGVIYFSPPTTVRHQNERFPLEFHISQSLRTKPDTADQGFSSDDSSGKPECFGPGSDIANSDSALLLAVIHNTHLLVVNKFSVFRPQLLLLTSDSYRRQREPLALEEFAAVCAVLRSLKSPPHLAIYNCGPVAGASRDHKHMQILPRPRYLFPDDPNFDLRVIPYRFFLRYLDVVDFGSPNGFSRIFQIYQELLANAKGAFAPSVSHGSDYFPHNVALVQDWIIVIPRQRIDVDGLTANAAGMLGTVCLKDEEQLRSWKQVGPKKVLSGLGFPRDSEEEWPSVSQQ